MLRKLILLVFVFVTACGGSEYLVHTPEKKHSPRIVNWKHYTPAVVRTGMSLDRPVLLYFTAKDCVIVTGKQRLTE